MPQSSTTEHALEQVLAAARACTLCAAHLPLGPRPVVRAHPAARVLIVGQAPGTRVHASGIPWDDPSGDRLRAWLEVDRDRFYDPRCFAIVPMGFCYPGRGKGGDLPPRPECHPTWHGKITALLPEVRLTLLLSRYAIDAYLGPLARGSVRETVGAFAELPTDRIALPHPSPRNNRWLRENPWFEAEVLPELRRRVRAAFEADGISTPPGSEP
ncbi:MAG: uracil-DNA glycosylase family protein [Deltaproteobacteria bacterium]|nr:uracil-DNA glycosylase family protein [Deltaproteobacteria bacterium]